MRLDVYDKAGNPVASAEAIGRDATLTTRLNGPATYFVGVTLLYRSLPFPEQEYSLTVSGSTVGLPRRITGDFDGFNGADRVLYNPATGIWTREYYAAFVQFGEPGDIPVVGDYNGDGGADHAVYRPSTGMWYVRGQFAVQFGDRGDIPVPADYDGDSVTDVAVYRPSTGFWYVRNQFAVRHGGIGAVPIPADYNGDGSDDVAVYRVTSGLWDVRNQFKVVYGGSGDLPIPGDYNGDGKADVAVFRTANGGGLWDVKGQFIYAGNPGIPVPNDYDGDGTTDARGLQPVDALLVFGDTDHQVSAGGVRQPRRSPGPAKAGHHPRHARRLRRRWRRGPCALSAVDRRVVDWRQVRDTLRRAGGPAGARRL